MTQAAQTSRATASAAHGPVERAFSLLQAVVAADAAVGVRELGRRTGLPRSTTSRLLAQLADLGMVERTAGGTVVPGSALATLAVSGGLAPLLRDRLRPLLGSMAEEFGESAALAVDDGDAVLYVSQINSASAVRAPDVEAERHPFHVVAHGLAIMAWWDDQRLDHYLAGPLAASTPSSVTDPSAISERLQQVRSDGYVWTVEEFDHEVNGVAVPVVRDGQAVASVGLYGPSYRLAPHMKPNLASALADVVSRSVASFL